MDNKEFVMASEWMVDGSINSFVKVHRDVNRFELVRFQFLLQTSLITNNYLILTAQRCHPGADVHAW